MSLCLFVSVPQLKPWCSPNAGWEGSVYSHFPTHVHTVVNTSVVLPAASAAALLLWRFKRWSPSCQEDYYIWKNPDMKLSTQHFALALPFWLETIRCQQWLCQVPLIGAHCLSEFAYLLCWLLCPPDLKVLHQLDLGLLQQVLQVLNLCLHGSQVRECLLVAVQFRKSRFSSIHQGTKYSEIHFKQVQNTVKFTSSKYKIQWNSLQASTKYSEIHFKQIQKTVKFTSNKYKIQWNSLQTNSE